MVSRQTLQKIMKKYSLGRWAVSKALTLKYHFVFWVNCMVLLYNFCISTN